MSEPDEGRLLDFEGERRNLVLKRSMAEIEKIHAHFRERIRSDPPPTGAPPSPPEDGEGNK